ncbi:hypothetical protein L3Q82_026434, partial [Scortum barcoo]
GARVWVKEKEQLVPATVNSCADGTLVVTTDYGETTRAPPWESPISNNSTSLPAQLNQFYCRFETHNRETERTHAHTWDRHDPPPSVSSALRRVNPRKAAGPDNIPWAGPQVLVLYSLFTHDCVASHKYNTILKFADDTTVIGLISGGDETAYRSEVASLVKWMRQQQPLPEHGQDQGDGPGHEEREEAALTSDDLRL